MGRPLVSDGRCNEIDDGRHDRDCMSPRGAGAPDPPEGSNRACLNRATERPIRLLKLIMCGPVGQASGRRVGPARCDTSTIAAVTRDSYSIIIPAPRKPPSTAMISPVR